MRRVGIYLWAGPGTLRLLQTKYHHPQINTASFLHAYDQNNLQSLKQVFNLTDAWVTYSWGFSDHTESADYQFLQDHLDNFVRLKLHTHAYVQGLNLVTSEFSDIDPWCRDHHDHLLPYSKGRSFTCPNNPAATAVILNRVQRACQLPITSVYIDNLIFGLPPFDLSANYAPFFGCSCKHCQQAFHTEFGYPLPIAEKQDQQLRDYLRFRRQSVRRLLQQIHHITKAHGKKLGINLMDPVWINPLIYFGYTLPDVRRYVDYLFVENHQHPSNSQGNQHLTSLIKQTTKPIFVISYKNDIGHDPQTTHSDIIAVQTEADQLGYHVCLKGSEFTTRGAWHTFDPQQYQQAGYAATYHNEQYIKAKLSPTSPWQCKRDNLLQSYYAPIMRWQFENPIISQLIDLLKIREKQKRRCRAWEV